MQIQPYCARRRPSFQTKKSLSNYSNCVVSFQKNEFATVVCANDDDRQDKMIQPTTAFLRLFSNAAQPPVSFLLSVVDSFFFALFHPLTTTFHPFKPFGASQPPPTYSIMHAALVVIINHALTCSLLFHTHTPQKKKTDFDFLCCVSGIQDEDGDAQCDAT